MRSALKNYWHSMQSCKTIYGGMRYSRPYTFCFVCMVAIHAIFVSAVPPDLTGIQNDQMDNLINVFVLVICHYLSLIWRNLWAVTIQARCGLETTNFLSAVTKLSSSNMATGGTSAQPTEEDATELQFPKGLSYSVFHDFAEIWLFDALIK